MLLIYTELCRGLCRGLVRFYWVGLLEASVTEARQWVDSLGAGVTEAKQWGQSI
jgi:hypothetical protein